MFQKYKAVSKIRFFKDMFHGFYYNKLLNGVLFSDYFPLVRVRIIDRKQLFFVKLTALEIVGGK